MDDKDVRTCFVIMPISDISGYDTNHFKRVYEFLIKPACEKAGFNAVRADDVVSSNHIVIDILRKIIESDIVLCDLSGRNPNVLYELGLRQAFNRPAALIKDEKTSDIFDIQGFRYFQYDHQLRIDNVKKEVDIVARSIIDTYERKNGDVNTVVQLLGIEPAQLEEKVHLSQENSIILDAINGLGKRLSTIEKQYRNTNRKVNRLQRSVPDDYASLRQFYEGRALDQAIGKEFYVSGELFGTLIDYNIKEDFVEFAKGGNDADALRVSIDSDLFDEINQVPF